MLCRVFHRSKESLDNIDGSNIELSHRFMLDTAASIPTSSNNLASMPCGYSSIQNHDPLSSSSNSTLFQDNPISDNGNNSSKDNISSLFHLLHHHLDMNSSDISSKVVDDTYGFFWDDGPSSNSTDVSGMRIDLDGDGLVFR